ncbi:MULTISPECIES: hypothetical protein [unclassified Microcoleus]|uniref:hypothetical protein n=1 Tax=unclassified Microcoleus TaxID=2642155 RepID=UPI002FD124FF
MLGFILEEEGSSATDSVREGGRRKFGNGLCNGCNGCQEEGSLATSTVRDVTEVRNKEERGRKKEEGRVSAINNILIVLVVARQ